MTYHEIERQLNRRGLFHIKPGLQRIRSVLKLLGEPQQRVRIIHIAGTNGKGSVAASLESILRVAGHSTGLYISPHLKDLTERVQISGKPITKNFFASLGMRVLRAEKAGRLQLTYFEFVTAMAFLAFERRKVDFAVMECGLGGLWDATNAVEKPVASVITSIGIDHSQWLGKTEAAITLQKAGIIKPQVPLISGVRGAGQSVIAQKAREEKAPLSQLDRDFGADRLTSLWRSGEQQIRYWDKEGRDASLRFGLLGAHQSDNAALAIRTIDVLKSQGHRISADALRRGLQQVSWPGRFDLRLHPGRAPILFDGAHNPHAMRTLLHALQESPFRTAPKLFVFSVYKDKDYRTLARMIQPLAESIYITSLPGPRALALSELRHAFTPGSARVVVARSSKEALRRACQDAPADGLVVVTGSLALVGTLLPPLHSKKIDKTQKEEVHV